MTDNEINTAAALVRRTPIAARVTYRGPNRWHSDGRPFGHGCPMAAEPGARAARWVGRFGVALGLGTLGYMLARFWVG